MDYINHIHHNPTSRQQFPICMTKSVCSCFEELRNCDLSEDDSDPYIIQSIDQIEQFIHLVNIHYNKECVIEMPYSTKTTALVVRRMVHFMNQTRKKFSIQAHSERICYIDFIDKCVPVNQYLRFIFLHYIYLDSLFDVMMNPDSEMSLAYLRQLLQLHLDLLFIFQQYINLKRYGFSYSTKTMMGTVNRFSLFYYE